MLVQAILTSKATDGVVTVAPTATVSEAAKILAQKRIGTVVVSEDEGKTAIGILSERDIVRELAASGSGCLNQPVESYMTRELMTATQQESVQDIMTRMTEGRFRHMPIVEDGKLIGIVTIGDVVKAQLTELAMEKDALQGMIMGH
ncbi:CBS domain-containing protein [Ruegeria profundi]|uniref:Histidine kinase n=1 Tax=Ruegeria profundi TaxID=1685378 RepID=A0A0X3U111_9RHOB|nr:CBS domain-containing protein [Ruegeria profundi]KUJ81735.1 histidine kinase [Ruegeria profundi]MCA0926895.1 CBS domain-containing protein [Ruegeria profundi]